MQPGDDDDDGELLRRYARQRDEAAFTRVVRRHVDLVFSAAIRRVGDRHLAEDVTQAVFVILARKAGRLCNVRDVVLSGWLLQCVRYASANAIKMETRRRTHERAAAIRSDAWGAGAGAGACSSNPTDVLIWHEVAQQLDDAVLRLPAADREAVLLRYFEDRPIRDIATKLNVTEGAAKQRVSRALEKLRQLLSRHNAALTSALHSPALAALLSSHAVRAAPPGLWSSVVAAATGSATAA